MATASLRVVIADDEPITRMDLKELLEEKGYQVIGEATDGFDAIEICKGLRPDLVLMDIKMPLLDGLSAARIMNEEQFGAAIVLLTAYSEREFIDTAKEIWSSRSTKNPSFPALNWRWHAATRFASCKKTSPKWKSVWKAAASSKRPRDKSCPATACARKRPMPLSAS